MFYMVELIHTLYRHFSNWETGNNLQVASSTYHNALSRLNEGWQRNLDTSQTFHWLTEDLRYLSGFSLIKFWYYRHLADFASVEELTHDVCERGDVELREERVGDVRNERLVYLTQRARHLLRRHAAWRHQQQQRQLVRVTHQPRHVKVHQLQHLPTNTCPVLSRPRRCVQTCLR